MDLTVWGKHGLDGWTRDGHESLIHEIRGDDSNLVKLVKECGRYYVTLMKPVCFVILLSG